MRLSDLVDSGIELTYEREARAQEDYDWTFENDEELVKSWEECLRNGINLVYEGGRIPPRMDFRFAVAIRLEE